MIDPQKPSFQPAIEEPLLDIDQIQGNVFPGFNKPHQALLGLVIEDAARAKGWLKDIAGEIATVRSVMEDRKVHRALKRRLGHRPSAADHTATHVGIGFSYSGMLRLRRDAQSFESDAFRLGLPQRSPLLGDPTDPTDEGAPPNWVVGRPGDVPEFLLVVASDLPDERTRVAQQLAGSAAGSGLRVVYQEDGDVLPGELRGHEHFGFADGVSQPGVRGLLSKDPPEYVEDRWIDPSALPDSLLYALPGQELVWPGAFVLGYPSQTQDPLIPGSVAPVFPGWARNGSFLVFRRYRQDVRLFWDVMEQEARRLSSRPGFEQTTSVSLSARLVGRWPSGAPYARVPGGDVRRLGKDQVANNHFRFDSDTHPVPLINGERDTYPNAKADPVGFTCPMMSHIRNVNTRDSSNDTGGTLGTYTHRLLRRGIAFGAPLLEGPITGDRPKLAPVDPIHGNRGLLFLGFLSSIEDQFEFLCNRWMSNRFAPRSPSGDDLIIGLNGNAGQDRVRQGVVFGSNLQAEEISTNAPWLIPTGGGYFFTPSIDAIRTILAA
jgi:Dyp-type peroxidase family